MASCMKYFTLSILTVINLLNYMDRFTLSGILQQLEDYGFKQPFDDTQGGLLQTAFIVSYMLLSPIFGYLGDRYTRKYIISVGILLWSVFTLTGSFATNYWFLLATRCLVGIGEASYATVAPTIIADLFPTHKRLRMLSVFYIAMPLGGALGYIIGSEVVSLAGDVLHDSKAQSWRWALRVTPVLGAVAAVVVLLFVKEPPRGNCETHRHRSVRARSGFRAYAGDVKYLLQNKTFLSSTVGFTAVTFTTGALAQWAPTFVVRMSRLLSPEHPFTQRYASLVFGVVTFVAGITGTVCGSELSKLLGHWTLKAEAYVCSISMLLATPFLYAAITTASESLYPAWICVFMSVFCFCLNWAPVAAILLYSVVPTRRSSAEALQILISHLFGDAISPTVIGVVSDSIFRRIKPYHNYEYYSKAVGTQFSLFLNVFVCVLGGAAFLVTTLTVERDRKMVQVLTEVKRPKIQREDSSVVSSDDFDERKELFATEVTNNR